MALNTQKMNTIQFEAHPTEGRTWLIESRQDLVTSTKAMFGFSIYKNQLMKAENHLNIYHTASSDFENDNCT